MDDPLSPGLVGGMLVQGGAGEDIALDAEAPAVAADASTIAWERRARHRGTLSESGKSPPANGAVTACKPAAARLSPSIGDA
jgi:hypothetical protein